MRRLRHLLPGVTDQKAVDGHLCVSVTRSMNINIRGIVIMGITRKEKTFTESESPSQGSMRPVYTPDSVSQPSQNICIQIVDKSSR